MISTNQRIMVRVDMEQKETMRVGNVTMKTAIRFEKNYREKSPVLAEVVQGKGILKKGDVVVCHHNHFHSPSPYQLEDNVFSIPFNQTIFALVTKSGGLKAICGNVLGQRIEKKYSLEVPIEFREKYIDRLEITDKGWSSFKNGTTVFCKPYAPYDIVYNFEGVEKRITKLDTRQITGILVK